MNRLLVLGCALALAGTSVAIGCAPRSEDDFTVTVGGVQSEVMLFKSPMDGAGTRHRHAAYYPCVFLRLNEAMAEQALAGGKMDSPLTPTAGALTDDGPTIKWHSHQWVIPPANWLDLSVGQTWTTEPDESGHQHAMTLVKVCPAD